MTSRTPLPEDIDTVDDGSTTRAIRHDTFELPVFGTIFTYDAVATYKCKKRTLTSPDPPYTPPTINGVEYVVDVQNLWKNPDNVGDGDPTHLKGYRLITAATQTTNDASYTVVPASDGSSIAVQATASGHACFKGNLNDLQIRVDINPAALAAAIAAGAIGFLPAIVTGGPIVIATYEAAATAIDFASAPSVINQQQSSARVAYEVFLRSKEPLHDTGEIDKKFLITSRALCCCEDHGHDFKTTEGIVYESSKVILNAGTFVTPEIERNMRSAVRREMLRSTVSARRTAPRPLPETQLALDLMLPILLKDPLARPALAESAADATPDDLLSDASPLFRQMCQHMSGLQVLRTDTTSLAKGSGLDEHAIHRLKSAILAKRFELRPLPPELERLVMQVRRPSSSTKPRETPKT